MHISKYLVTFAENEEDAKLKTESWLDEYAGKEFFEYGVIDEESEKQVVSLDEIREQLEAEKAELEKKLPEIEEEIRKCKESGNKSMEGDYHKRYGFILCEELTEDMPYFNIDLWDWSLPDEKKDNGKWYAVLADFNL
jgi:hypothetical protein